MGVFTIALMFVNCCDSMVTSEFERYLQDEKMVVYTCNACVLDFDVSKTIIELEFFSFIRLIIHE